MLSPRANNMILLATTIVAAVAVAVSGTALADYPEKPIKFIVPYSAGGASDIVARIIQKGLEGELPQPVVVINKPGAGGALGAREAMEAEPDGYTVLSTHIGIHTNHLMGKADFSYQDFEPVAETGTIQLIMTVPGDSRFESMADLITEAKANSDTVTHATNLTSVLHLAALQSCQGDFFRRASLATGLRGAGGRGRSPPFSEATFASTLKTRRLPTPWPRMPMRPTTAMLRDGFIQGARSCQPLAIGERDKHSAGAILRAIALGYDVGARATTARGFSNPRIRSGSRAPGNGVGRPRRHSGSGSWWASAALKRSP